MVKMDSSLRQLTGYRMRRAMLPILARVNEVLAPMGLRRATFSALVIVRDNPGLRQGELAEMLMIEKPNLVQIINSLEEEGLIERRRSEDDRRVNALYITDQGCSKCETGLAEIRAFEESFTEGFKPSEIEALHKALDQIRKNAEAGRR